MGFVGLMGLMGKFGFMERIGLMGRPGLVRRLGRVGRGRVWLWGALLGVLLMVGVAAACGGEEERPVGGVESIALMSSDGLVMHAEVWRGGETWLLLGHMFTANLEAWDSIAEGFQARGYSVLTWDFRGHGQTEDFAHIPQELWAAEIFREWLAALDYAEAEGAEAIYGAGASMGGTSLAVVASLEAAGEERLEGFVLVSAPTVFRGLDGLANYAAVTIPRLIIVGVDDRSAPTFARLYHGEAAGPSALVELPTNLHGNTLTSDEEFGPQVLALMLEFVPGVE